MRFLMQNLLKLAKRINVVPEGQALLSEYFSLFPDDADNFSRLYMDIWRLKEERSEEDHGVRLLKDVGEFLESFESQFRKFFSKTPNAPYLFDMHQRKRMSAVEKG